MQFQWEGGRKLTSFSTPNAVGSYVYNSDGIRVYKEVNGNTTEYYLNGTEIETEITNFGGITRRVDYIYDENGSIYGFVVDNTNKYYYTKNLQGDIIGILDSAGTTLVEYSYDAWGKATVSYPNTSGLTDAEKQARYLLGSNNPFRYRGYYFDNETGFYYLNSRYYDPETGRFINADSVTDGGAGIIGNNLFIYAANNPVNNMDPSGSWIIKNAIKWVAKNVVKPIVKTVQKALSNIDATRTCGINLTGTPGIFAMNYQIGISVDTKGNVALQQTVSGGVTASAGWSGSATIYETVTNAPSVKKLEGPAYQIGGSVAKPVYGVPLSVGAEVNIIPDKELNKLYYGLTTSFGFGSPGAEAHVEWGETVTLMQFNTFDVARNIYIKIMEW